MLKKYCILFWLAFDPTALLAPNGGCMEGRSVTLVKKVVCRSVWPSKWMTVGPRIQGAYPQPLDQTDSNQQHGRPPWGATSLIMRISDVAGHMGRQMMPHGVRQPNHVGPSRPATSTCLLCTFLCIFLKIPCIQIYFEVQVELGEI
jgi:hypothetical protein